MPIVVCATLIIAYTIGIRLWSIPRSEPFNRTNEKLKKLMYNLEWLYKNYKHFEKYHKNQFVAIKDKSFLDNDTELEKLVKRLKIVNFDDSIAIEFIY